MDELSLIMRSLGMSPTIAELRKYLKDKGMSKFGRRLLCDPADIVGRITLVRLSCIGSHLVAVFF